MSPPGATSYLRALLAIVAIAPPLLFGTAARLNYAQVIEGAEEQIETTANVLREHALRVLDIHALGVEQILDRTTTSSIDDIERSESLHRYLANLSRGLGSQNQLWISDANGRERASSISFPPPRHPVSDREFFIAHLNHDAGIYVSAPYRPRAGGSK
jgi:two-component system NtrC family sensor kinase